MASPCRPAHLNCAPRPQLALPPLPPGWTKRSDSNQDEAWNLASMLGGDGGNFVGKRTIYSHLSRGSFSIQLQASFEPAAGLCS
ncbi:hypothetical protein V6N12_040231 [Hibiscus sabdariffa]|uniref:Uncharacterized protein n=1 Tax=Hibiscus sabdariffa TaxID=183260 RepID=A0ABR2E327_9ROSI